MITFTKQFKLLADISRAIKSERLLVTRSHVYSYDDYPTLIFSDVNPFQDLVSEEFTIGSGDITFLEKVLKTDKQAEVEFNLQDNSLSCIGEVIYLRKFNPTISYENIMIANKKNIVLEILHGCHPKSYKDIRTLPEFESILDSKSSEGSSMFSIDGYIMTIYPSLLNINKSDDVDLDIYDYHQTCFLSKFSISKKNFRVNTCAVFLKV